MQDDFSILSGIEFYQLIDKAVRPISTELVDAYLFFNRVPGLLRKSFSQYHLSHSNEKSGGCQINGVYTTYSKYLGTK